MLSSNLKIHLIGFVTDIADLLEADTEIESKVYARNIEYVLKPAIQFGDEEIIQMFISYSTKNKGIFLCELNDIIFEKEKQIKKTLSYRIGNFLLWPLKKIKGLNIE